MKNISIYGLLVVTALSFNACDDKRASYSDTTTILNTGDTVVVNSGDSITPNIIDTRIKVNHNVNQGIKEVTILSGEAILVTGNNKIVTE